MKPSLAILCYHRIVDVDDDSAWPYLERGTAVRLPTFSAQLADIRQFADIVSEDAALAVLAKRRYLDRPSVWLTFDDGYSDVKRAVPHAETATVFVTTSASERLLPADAWYAVLLSARRARGVLDLGQGTFEFDLAAPAGRARLVDGPERRVYLRSRGAQQQTMLHRLAEQLEGSLDAWFPYLDDSDLRALVGAGWSLGSHGVTHIPFDVLTGGEVRAEVVASRERLRSLGASVRSTALPDGVRAHVEVVAEAGYECVLGLGDATCNGAAAVQPRFLVPDERAWVARVLEPALCGGVLE